MDSPSIAMANPPPLQRPPYSLWSTGRKSSSSPSTSPEFEFWMVRNPSLTPPNILSADELFVDGVMLPLQRLSLPQNEPTDTAELQTSSPASVDVGPPPIPDSEPRSGPEITSEPASSSKRWMDIFKKSGDKKSADGGITRAEDKVKGKKGKKERRGRNASGSPELNINIWPFTRSRSAGTSRTRPGIPVVSPVSRKASSAPCSRSNSAGDSKSRVKWPSSPGRIGVHVGRSSPVWQARRGGAVPSGGSDTSVRSAPKIVKKGYSAETEAKRLNLNVPTCIGYRSSLGCRGEETGPGDGRAGSGGMKGRAVGYAAGGGGNLFNIRSIFTKKVY